jgi:flagellar protein FlgJ
MTTVTSSPLLPTTAPTTATTSDSEKLSGVAKQFEAIFLRQMLASARKSNLGGEDNIFSGQGLDTFRQMQDDRFADIASETGAFGLGKMIETHLAKFAQATSSPAETGTPATAQTTGATAKQEVTGNGI